MAVKGAVLRIIVDNSGIIGAIFGCTAVVARNMIIILVVIVANIFIVIIRYDIVSSVVVIIFIGGMMVEIMFIVMIIDVGVGGELIKPEILKNAETKFCWNHLM